MLPAKLRAVQYCEQIPKAYVVRKKITRLNELTCELSIMGFDILRLCINA